MDYELGVSRAGAGASFLAGGGIGRDQRHAGAL